MRVTGATSPSAFHESDDIDSDITTTTRLTGRHDPTYVHGDAEPLNEDEEEYEEVVIIKRRRKKRDENKSEVDMKQENKSDTTPNQTSTTVTSTVTPTTPASTKATETIPAVPTSMKNVTSASSDAANTVSSSVASGSTTSSASRPSPSQSSVQDAPFTSTYRYLFLRTFLIFSLFLLFQYLYDKYYWIPHHRPHQLPEHDMKMKQQIQDKIRSQMCPPGVECSYQLPQDYELNWKQGEVYGQEPKEAAIHQEHVMDPAVEAELQHEIDRYEREQQTGETNKYKKDKRSKSQEMKDKKDKKKGRKGRRGEVGDL